MTHLFLGVGLLAVVGIAWMALSSSIDGAVDRAIKDNDPGPVVDAIRKRAAAAQPTVYNHAIRRMWDAYERPLAAEIIRTLASDHHTERIAQYWLKQILSAEPSLAQQAFTKKFIDSYYLPEVAASCGKVG